MGGRLFASTLLRLFATFSQYLLKRSSFSDCFFFPLYINIKAVSPADSISSGVAETLSNTFAACCRVALVLNFFKTAALLMPYKWEVVSCQESHDEKAFACKHMCPFQFSPSWIFLGHRGEKNIKLTQRSMMYEEHKITFKTTELIEFF